MPDYHTGFTHPVRSHCFQDRLELFIIINNHGTQSHEGHQSLPSLGESSGLSREMDIAGKRTGVRMMKNDRAVLGGVVLALKVMF